MKFASGAATIQVLQAASDAEWARLLRDDDVVHALQQAGISPSAVPEQGAFKVSAASSGFDISGADVAIGVGVWAVGVVGDAAKELLLELWRTRVLPRIVDRLGDDVIGPKQD